MLALEAAGLIIAREQCIGRNRRQNGASSAPVSKELYEEELCDVSLATFHVFDRENAGIQGVRARLAMGACGGGGCGCGGCGCACGIGLYYHYTPPVLGDPVDPPPRPIRPAHKYKSHSPRARCVSSVR